MRTGSLAVVNIGVFDGESADLVDGPIVIRDGVVVGVGPHGDTRTVGLRVLDGAGGVVIPGLLDAHCHAYGFALTLRDLETPQLSYVALAAARRLRRALRRGFTTVRDVAGGDGGLARALAEGLIQAPRYLFTGAALSQTGGHGDSRLPEEGGCCQGEHSVQVVDGPDALRVAVRDRFRQGAHAIKILASGGVVSPADPLTIPQYSAEEIALVAVEARRRGSYVAAHAYAPDAIVAAVTNGVRSIEHGNLLNERAAAVMAEHSAYLVPTLITYDAMARRGDALGMPVVSQVKNTAVLEAGFASLQLAQRAGVPIGFGTDLMGALEDEQLNGLRLQSEGMGILETLRSATSRNADLFGRPDLGRLHVGSAGDLVVLRGNPFDRPEVLWSTERRPVVLAGRLVAGAD